MPTLLFTAANSWISRSIRWFTRSKASHVMIGIEVYGVPMLLHSSGGGVQISRRDEWLAGNYLVAEYEIKPDVEDGVRHAMKHIGERYDYGTLFGWAAVILLWRYLRIKAKNPLQSPTAMVCSEFVLHMDMDDEGNGPGVLIPEWKDMDPESTHCQDLLDKIMPGGSFELIAGA